MSLDNKDILKGNNGWISVKDLFDQMNNDFDRYPLPIEFDEKEELKELRFREWRLKEIAMRFARIRNIRQPLPSPPQNNDHG